MLPLRHSPAGQAASRASCAAARSPAARAANPTAVCPNAAYLPPSFAPRLEGRVGRGPGRGRVTLVCQCDALADEAGQPRDLIVSRLGLGGQLAELCDGSGQIALHHLRRPEAKAALARVEPVTDRVGEVASFLAGRAYRDRVTRGDRRPSPAGRGSG